MLFLCHQSKPQDKVSVQCRTCDTKNSVRFCRAVKPNRVTYSSGDAPAGCPHNLIEGVVRGSTALPLHRQRGHSLAGGSASSFPVKLLIGTGCWYSSLPVNWSPSSPVQKTINSLKGFKGLRSDTTLKNIAVFRAGDALLVVATA